jgi:CubicO group peptidase (beta-lactamase class C family)
LARCRRCSRPVSILQLVQQGKLSVDDRLITVLPDYPDKDIANKVTIYQLLTHTSGFGNYFRSKLYQNTPKDRFDTLAAHLPLFVGEPLLFEPATRWSYSNSGFIVLGLVIEKLSGETYNDYVRKHVFPPAGMTSTDNYQPHDDVPNFAIGYTTPPKAAEPGRRALDFPGGLPPAAPRITNVDFLEPSVSAGGGYSTVEDMLRFSRALQGCKLLDKVRTDLIMTGKVATPRAGKYGFGMGEEFVDGVRIVGHNGGGAGIHSNLDMYPDLGYTAVVLTNLDGAYPLANERIRMWLTGQEFPRAIHLPSGALQAFVGTYAVAFPGASGEGPSMQIVAGREELWLTSGDRHRLVPLSATEFFDDNAPSARFAFSKTETGEIVGFTMTNKASTRPPLSATRKA